MIIFGSTYVFFNSLCFDNESLDVLLFILPIVEDEAVLRIRSFELNLFKNKIILSIIEILFCCCDNNIFIAVIVNVVTMSQHYCHIFLFWIMHPTYLWEAGMLVKLLSSLDGGR